MVCRVICLEEKVRILRSKTFDYYSRTRYTFLKASAIQ